MDVHPDLIRQLNYLSEALDDGTDLYAVLAVLADDLLAVVPGFLGLELTFADADTPLTLTTLAGSSSAVRASMLLPLAQMGWTTELNSTLIYYADTPHAFVALAADVRATFDLDGQVVVDQHLEPATGPPSVFTDLDDLSTVNQAIGILIGRGDLTLEQAQSELHRLAVENHLPPVDIARRLIAEPHAFE